MMNSSFTRLAFVAVVIASLSFVLTPTMAAPSSSSNSISNSNNDELEQALADEIKEYHFHVYFFQDNAQSNRSAQALFKKIERLIAAGFFHPVPYKINYAPRGPHPIGSYEIWCPKEHFSRAYSWFLQNRGEHPVLVHPLTIYEVIDHTNRVAWMGGTSMPLDTDQLTQAPLPSVPLQYPELGMGYSAPSTSSNNGPASSK